jgi:hypothetical protein
MTLMMMHAVLALCFAHGGLVENELGSLRL